jgi:hypothetical protein
MAGVAFTAVLLSLYRPSVFLLLLAVFSFYQAFSGYRVLSGSCRTRVTTLQAIGVALAGQAGARLATHLRLPTSPATLLCQNHCPLCCAAHIPSCGFRRTPPPSTYAEVNVAPQRFAVRIHRRLPYGLAAISVASVWA